MHRFSKSRRSTLVNQELLSNIKPINTRIKEESSSDEGDELSIF